MSDKCYVPVEGCRVMERGVKISHGTQERTKEFTVYNKKQEREQHP